MNITINGKITNVLPPVKGVSKRGNEWVAQDYVIEDNNGAKICFNVFGADNIQKYGLKVGSVASVTCEVKSNEWNGKWFTQVSCTDCITQGNNQPQQTMKSPQAQQQAAPQHVPQQPMNNSNQTSADDLPF